jgi:hypothetical protein
MRFLVFCFRINEMTLCVVVWYITFLDEFLFVGDYQSVFVYLQFPQPPGAHHDTEHNHHILGTCLAVDTFPKSDLNFGCDFEALDA